MKSGKRMMAGKALRKCRNTYRLLEAVSQDLSERINGIWSTLKDLPRVEMRMQRSMQSEANNFGESDGRFCCHP